MSESDLTTFSDLNVLSGDQGNKWNLVKVDLPANLTNKDRVFQYRAESPRGVFGDIALDDLEWFDKKCEDVELQQNNPAVCIIE